MTNAPIWIRSAGAGGSWYRGLMLTPSPKRSKVEWLESDRGPCSNWSRVPNDRIRPRVDDTRPTGYAMKAHLVVIDEAPTVVGRCSTLQSIRLGALLEAVGKVLEDLDVVHPDGRIRPLSEQAVEELRDAYQRAANSLKL